MSDGFKTHLRITLPCGCIQLRWLFGRETIDHCAKHRRMFHPADRLPDHAYKWPRDPAVRVSPETHE